MYVNPLHYNYWFIIAVLADYNQHHDYYKQISYQALLIFYKNVIDIKA